MSDIETKITEVANRFSDTMTNIEEGCKTLSIVDQDSFSKAATFLTGVKALQKDVAATFDPIKKPSHEAHKAACTQEKKFLAPLEAAEKTIKERMGIWLKTFDDFNEITADGVTVRKSYKFKIIDPSLIPDEYWIIDEKKIGAVVTALREQCPVQGIEVYSEPVIVAGSTWEPK